ncbi:MAG: LacI family DNA-binding transcriptional regulator [Lachnospiraceae bacterium]|nr:LacI family DNA-binding transcriptional regulator [Lachnospiraceae bacterium]MCI9342313.1 LacI family DNA-binding transcriptional regulator [Lachnospiraceae bacterium]
MTIKEIAQLAGVSISTVSKIVNDKASTISPSTKERVLKIVKEYNYTPYGMVKDTSNARTFLLGVLLRTFRNMNTMLDGIIKSAQEHGYHVLLFNSENDIHMELRHITAICQKKLDGILWEPVNNASSEHAHYLEEQEISVCYICSDDAASNAISPELTLSSYRIDYKKMGYLLTQKLVDLKHSKLTCLLRKNDRRSALVLSGFKKCLYDNNIPFDEKLPLCTDDVDHLKEVMTLGITGIVSSHFASALLLYEQLDQFHYHIPSDLSLVSLADDMSEIISFPHISGIKIPYYHFGYFACENLIKKCEGNQPDSSARLFTTDWTFNHEASISIPSFLRSKKIVAIGSINKDMTFNVDSFPQAGKTINILNATTSVGGKGANQAVGAAKLGREVSLIGQIGNDTDSAFIMDTLLQAKISNQGIHRDMHAQTGKAFIFIEGNGESAITVMSGANANLSPEEVKACQHLFQNAGFCLLSTELPMPTILEAAKIGAAFGAKIIMKPAALKSIPEQLFQYTDIFIPNRKEAAFLCPGYKSIEEQAEYFFRKGIETIIITLGEDGCFLKTAQSTKHFPAASFASVDTTGGADAFISALASYLIEGRTLEDAIRIATYAAGFCVSRRGVVPALVDKNTLEAHIGQLEPDLFH